MVDSILILSEIPYSHLDSSGSAGTGLKGQTSLSMGKCMAHRPGTEQQAPQLFGDSELAEQHEHIEITEDANVSVEGIHQREKHPHKRDSSLTVKGQTMRLLKGRLMVVLLKAPKP
ncbi:putative histone acetyltransferase KAT6A [Sesbania bispinosa]|nr:putative histone acetyltransferase KAT6A [Sesbania bispinosa]